MQIPLINILQTQPSKNTADLTFFTLLTQPFQNTLSPTFPCFAEPSIQNIIEPSVTYVIEINTVTCIYTAPLKSSACPWSHYSQLETLEICFRNTLELFLAEE